jgi:uncharacterized protein YigE (DUF2233 family)
VSDARGGAVTGRREWLGVLLALLPALWGLSAGAEPAVDLCQPMVHGTTDHERHRYTVCEIDTQRYPVRLVWTDAAGEPFMAFGRLPARIDGLPVRLAMNAGMYGPDLSPSGLFIEEYQVRRRLNRANGPGNFHLKPNGVLLLDDGQAAVMETGRYAESGLSPRFATQSGPMLVIDGHIHPAFLEHSNSRRHRNGACVLDEHRLVLVITEQPVTLYRFARLFRDHIGCEQALYLDGSVSGLHDPVLGRSDFRRPLGPMLIVLQPVESGQQP